MRVSHIMVVTVTGVVAAAATLPGCAAGARSETAEPPTQMLRLGFDVKQLGAAGRSDIRNEGAEDADISLLSVNGGATSFVEGRDEGVALRLPRYSGSSNGSFAALRVTAASTEDWLSPGIRDFIMGADVKLDKRSSGSGIDNGDNVMQRGLFADASQYKMQVDKHRASCIVRGDEGTVDAKSDAQLAPGRWYHLECHRVGSLLKLTVLELENAGEPDTTMAEGAIGQVSAPAATPLAIGAKIGSNGEIVTTSTDQFNGEIDNVTYAAGP